MRLVSFRNTCSRNRVVRRVCDNNFYDARDGCDIATVYIAANPVIVVERELGRAFHKIPRVICFKRKREKERSVCSTQHSMLSRHSAVFTSANVSWIPPSCFYIKNSVADFIACTRDHNVCVNCEEIITGGSGAFISKINCTKKVTNLKLFLLYFFFNKKCHIS